jgi:hypothetical protein
MYIGGNGGRASAETTNDRLRTAARRSSFLFMIPLFQELTEDEPSLLPVRERPGNGTIPIDYRLPTTD